MRTRKKGVKKHKKYRTCFKIYKGGRSSSSDRTSSDQMHVVSIGQPKTASKAASKASSPKASSPKKTSPKASSPKKTSPKASSPKKASPKAASPKAASPKAASPKAASPKAASPKAASIDLTKIVPLHKLKGRGRDRMLPYKDNIHSEDDMLYPEKTEGVESKLRDKLHLLESSDKKMERNRKILERRIRASTPPPPPIELSPIGKDLITTYTPELDILDIELRIPVHGKPTATTPQYVLIPFEYKYHRLLPLSFLSKKQVSQQTKEHAKMVKYIGLFPKTYTYLSPILFYSLMGINRLDLYGKALVLGKLRDELIPNIALTSVEVMESRFFTTRDETIQIMKNIENIVKNNDVIGPTPANPTGPDIPGIRNKSPTTQPSPTSLQVVGYNKHPIFRTQPMSRDDEMQLVKLSEKHKIIRGEDYAFIVAHGSLVNELSPEMKLLANKYLRIIEIGKAGQVLSPRYQSIVVEINKILRNPEYNAMFDNTDEGEVMRKYVFSLLCPYIMVDKVSLCDASDTFDLVDITHDRSFSGHAKDYDIKQNHKVTYKSLGNMISMGIFLPVDYNTDKSTPYMAKKELFKLYPGTTFFSSTTNMNLVETLLPIAIKQNRRINLIIMSCGVSYIHGDSMYNVPQDTKPGENNPAINILTTSKKFLSNLNNLIDNYIVQFYSDGVVDFTHFDVNGNDVFIGYRDYAKDGKNDILFTIAEHVNTFYISKFQLFSQLMSNSLGNVQANFSFSGLNDYHISNDLISSNNPHKGEWYYKYIDEIIKVKIFLMHEFKNIFSLRIIMIRTSLDIIIENLTELRQKYGPGPFPGDVITQNTCNMLGQAIYSSTSMNDYFKSLENIVIYIKNGLSLESRDPDSFLDFKKYREIKKEYDEGAAKEFYENLVENLDYDRYEGENVGFKERVYKAKLLNPLPSDKFRKTKRFMYKYSNLPNYDQIKDRRKTMKKQLYDKMNLGKHARKAKKSSDVSV